jgi:acyl-CoA thioesterase
MNMTPPQGTFFERFDDLPFHRYLGLTLAEHRDGYARLRLTITEQTPTGVGGSVNGGVIATLVDMAALPAVFSGMREGSTPAGTADLQVTYLRQARGAWLDAEATVIKRGRQLCVVEVSVRNDHAALCARGRVLYALRTGAEQMPEG